MHVEIYDSLKDIDKDSFNAIVDEGNPFIEYEFLYALEESGSVGENTGWLPQYLILIDEKKIIGNLTWYIKFDSYGEYIFDWQWASAFENSGLAYYPKAVVSIPFTPATGTRVSIDKNKNYEQCFSLLITSLINSCKKKNISSIHLLFTTKKEHDLLEKLGFSSRLSHQYHWQNSNYNTFDDFLVKLKSKRRKQIKRERRIVNESNLEVSILTGDEIEKVHIEAMWNFYINTTTNKWGQAYLNKAFFNSIFNNFKHRLCLVIAQNDEGYVAGTWNFFKNDQLYGRYWGESKYYSQLHFECCYYKLIDFAIENKITKFEAGAQGEHKFVRGFAAQTTYSSHLIFNQSAKAAIDNFLTNERNHIKQMLTQYKKNSPYNGHVVKDP